MRKPKRPRRGNPDLERGTPYQFQKRDPARSESCTAFFALKVTPTLLTKLKGIPRDRIREALEKLVGECS